MNLRGALASVKGAVDLASIMVGVIVIGIIAGVISATVFAVIPWAQNSAAKESLASYRVAESVAMAENGSYEMPAALVSNGYLPGSSAQASGGQSDVSLASYVRTDASGSGSTLAFEGALGANNRCRVATVASNTGQVFWTTSESPDVYAFTAGSIAPTTDCSDISGKSVFPADVPGVISTVAATVQTAYNWTANAGAVTGVTLTNGSSLPTDSTFSLALNASSGKTMATATGTTGRSPDNSVELALPTNAFVSDHLVKSASLTMNGSAFPSPDLSVSIPAAIVPPTISATVAESFSWAVDGTVLTSVMITTPMGQPIPAGTSVQFKARECSGPTITTLPLTTGSRSNSVTLMFPTGSTIGLGTVATGSLSFNSGALIQPATTWPPVSDPAFASPLVAPTNAYSPASA